MGLARSMGIAAVLLLGAVAGASAQSGKAVGVNPAADAVLRSATRTLVVGSDVGIGETVKTGAEGKVELVFTDQTKLVIGPGSTLLIEDYLLRRDGSPGKFAVNALQGSFRFITGKSPKDDYQIKTATGTIGVRGTRFDFVVDRKKRETHIVLFEGGVHVCNTAGQCIDLRQKCEIATFGPAGTNLLSGDKRSEWQRKFPFANFPSSVSSPFRISGANSCMHNGTSATGVTAVFPSEGGNSGRGGGGPGRR